MARNREDRALSVELRRARQSKYADAARPIDWDALSQELRSNGRKRVVR